jgi:site-specific DNA recombinase
LEQGPAPRDPVNVTYIGQVSHKGKLYPGEQDAIIDKRVFREMQKLLKDNSQNGGAGLRNKHGAPLKGILKCGNCGAAMTHTFAKKDNRLYRYYRCHSKIARGAAECSAPALPAQEIEDFVVAQIRKVARDPDLARQVFTEAAKQQRALIPQVKSEKTRLQRGKQAKGEEIRRLVDVIGSNGRSAAIGVRLAEVEAVVSNIDRRLAEIESEIENLERSAVDPGHVAQTLAEFDGVWDVMWPGERLALIHSVIASVTCNDRAGVSIEFRLSLPPGTNARWSAPL